MGRDKGLGISVVIRVVMLGVILFVVGIRWWEYQKKVAKYVDGVRVKMVFRIGQIRWGESGVGWVEVGGIRINLPESNGLVAGQKIEAVGVIREKKISDKFNYLVLNGEKFEVVDKKTGIVGIGLTMREKLVNRVVSWLPGNEGALAVGLVFGGSEYFSKEIKTMYSRAGLTHVVSASGYNVAVVSGWAMILGKRFKRRWVSILFVIVCIGLYVILAGLSLPAIRAGIMGVITLVGLGLGRKSDAGWLWGMSGVLMVMLNPGWMMDVSFQLSMAATGGLIWLVTSKPNDKWWVESLKITLAAQVATLPIVLHHFGSASFVAPISNLGVLWIVPIAMQIIAMGVVVGGVWSGAGMVLIWLAWPLLKLFNQITWVMGGWKYAVWTVGFVSWWWVMGYYGVLIVGAYVKQVIKRNE